MPGGTARQSYPGLATDYAAMIKAALALHAATLDAGFIDRPLSASPQPFVATTGTTSSPGYFLSADDAEALILRPRSTTDEATPSANSVMAANNIRLWRLTGNDAYRADADAIIAAAPFAENLFAATAMLSALDLRLGAIDVVIVRPDGQDAADLIAAIRRAWTPNIILTVHNGAAALPEGHPAAGKTTVEGKATAYVCRGETCSLPITDAAALTGQLAPAKSYGDPGVPYQP